MLSKRGVESSTFDFNYFCNYFRLFVVCGFLLVFLFSLSPSALAGNFTLQGTIYNSTYGTGGLYNISFYKINEANQAGPPTKTMYTSNLTDGLGGFSVVLNTTQIYVYSVLGNDSTTSIQHPDHILLEIDPVSGFELNASGNLTVFTSKASTVNISFFNFTNTPVNGSGVCMKTPSTVDGNARIEFSDMIFENFDSSATNLSIVLPANTTVGCMFFSSISPGVGGLAFEPRYFSFTSNATAGDYDTLTVNTTTIYVNITVLFQYQENNSRANISGVDALMAFPLGTPAASYLVPEGHIDSTVAPLVNYTNHTAWIQVASPGTGTTMNFMVRAIATNGSGNGADTDQYFIGYQNVTLATNEGTSISLTLRKAIGNHKVGTGQGGVNVTKYTITMRDSNNNSVTDTHGEVLLKNYFATNTTILFMLDNWIGGQNTFLLPNSTNATLRTFGKGGPREFKLNTSAINTTIILADDNRHFGANGAETDLSSTEMDDVIRISIFRSGTGPGGEDCNLIPPWPACRVIENINPSGMTNIPMQGRMNILINDTESGSLLYFINAEMGRSAYSVRTSTSAVEDSTVAGRGFEEDHRFYSDAVRTYDEVKVGKLLKNIDTTERVSVLFKNVLDSDQRVVWNNSPGSGDGNATAIPQEFGNFPIGFFNRTAGGVVCTSNRSGLCHMNKTNSSAGYIWLQGNPADPNEIIHFSGFDPETSGTSSLSSVSNTGGVSSPSASGGGGSAKAATDAPTATASSAWSSVEAGSTLAMSVSKPNLAVTGLDIEVGEALSNLKVTVNSYSTRPEAVDTFKGAYQYIEIEKENAEESSIKSATIAFTVEDKWVQEKSIDPARIKLYHFVQDNWKGLETNYVGEVLGGHTYKATTTGFSFFAIAAEEETTVLPTEQAEIEEVSDVSAEEKLPEDVVVEETGEGNYTPVLWALLVVVLIAVIIYMLKRKH